MIPGMNVGGMGGMGGGGMGAAPGFNMPTGPAVNSVAPFQMLSPEQLAALAARAFQPPGGGGAPGLGGGGGAAGGQPDYSGVGTGMGQLTDFLTGGTKADLKEGVKPSITNPSYGDLGGPGGTFGTAAAAKPGWFARNIGSFG